MGRVVLLCCTPTHLPLHTGSQAFRHDAQPTMPFVPSQREPQASSQAASTQMLRPSSSGPKQGLVLLGKVPFFTIQQTQVWNSALALGDSQHCSPQWLGATMPPQERAPAHPAQPSPVGSLFFCGQTPICDRCLHHLRRDDALLPCSAHTSQDQSFL